MEGNGDGVGEEENTHVQTRINPPAWPDYTPFNMTEGDMASQSATLGVSVWYFTFLRNISLLNGSWPVWEEKLHNPPTYLSKSD